MWKHVNNIQILLKKNSAYGKVWLGTGPDVINIKCAGAESGLIQTTQVSASSKTANVIKKKLMF